MSQKKANFATANENESVAFFTKSNMENCTAYWNECLQILEDNLSKSAFNMWFKPIVPKSYDGQTLVLQVGSNTVAQYIDENYNSLLGATLARVFGAHVKLVYHVLIDSNAHTTIAAPSGVKTPEDILVSPRVVQPVMEDFDSYLNPKFTMDGFIQGEPNKLARAAGIAITKTPGYNAFNPLFIYGGPGVGKTHLANAIGNEIKRLDPTKRVLYVTATTFKQQYQTATINAKSAQGNSVNDFILFYQSVDVLILDDIQFWANATGTQTTFYSIFNHLHQSGKQLILLSDRAPTQLGGMEDRLLSRFKWGLTACISKPDLSLRKSILDYIIQRDGLSIPEEVIDYLATQVRDNIRDLEGVLTSLLAHSTLMDAEIDMKLAEEVVSRIVASTHIDMTLDTINQVVIDHYKISQRELVSASRKAELVRARMVAMYLAKKLTDRPLQEIGFYLGNRNHATVLHGIKTVENEMSYDAAFRRELLQLQEQLEQK